MSEGGAIRGVAQPITETDDTNGTVTITNLRNEVMRILPPRALSTKSYPSERDDNPTSAGAEGRRKSRAGQLTESSSSAETPEDRPAARARCNGLAVSGLAGPL